MNNQYITGKFTSSFSTTIIGKIEKPVIDLRDIELRGRKVLEDADFFLSEPSIAENDLKLKDTYISNVEIFPKVGLLSPLEKPKKLNLFQVHIVNPIITHQQDIDGVRHGVIEGLLYANLTDVKKDISVVKAEEKIKIPTIDPIQETVLEPAPLKTNSGCLLGSNLLQRGGCLPAASLLQNKGCMPGSGCLGIFRNGCLGIFLLLFLLGLLSTLFKTCSDHTTNKNDSDIVKTDDKTTDDFINDKDRHIEEKDTTAYVDTKTIKEIRTISLPNVQFFTNSSVLIPSSKKDLEQLAVYLLENQDVKANIIGHTDNVGEVEANIILSQNRAESVKTYLVSLGVNADRIKAIGKGSTEPKVSNDTEEGRLMNRRVEVELENNKSIEK
jgi:outer membrane protein OmpA-like peptidoglycan-associated protein